MDTVVKRLLLFGIALGTLAFGSVVSAQTGLQVRPLSYETTLEPGQPQDGVVDVSNPSDEPVTVRVSVQGFREGGEGLEFFDDRQLASGIQLDQDTIELEAKGAYRLVFQVDPAKLPSGDVRAAIMFTTTGEGEMVAQQVSVGTLLMITNGQAAPVATVGDDDARLTRWVFGGIAVVLVLGLAITLWLRRRKSLAFTKRP